MSRILISDIHLELREWEEPGEQIIPIIESRAQAGLSDQDDSELPADKVAAIVFDEEHSDATFIKTVVTPTGYEGAQPAWAAFKLGEIINPGAPVPMTVRCRCYQTDDEMSLAWRAKLVEGYVDEMNPGVDVTNEVWIYSDEVWRLPLLGNIQTFHMQFDLIEGVVNWHDLYLLIAAQEFLA